MYNKINITENGLQIISLFTNGFDREYYIREVEKLLKISPRTAQLILEDLENKSIAFMEKNLLVKGVIEKIGHFIDGIGVIFGSCAKGTSNKESDLDIFVAGEYNKEEIKKISRNLGIEISIKCYPLKTFEKNVNHDIFLKEVLKSHIVFKNTELFIQKVLKNG